jgi:hypothetical protein
MAHACAAILATLTVGHAHGGDLRTLAIDELKSVYLSCTHDVVLGRLPTGAIMWCSVVYEELKLRAFDGDFAKLLAWSRAQPPVPGR